MPLYQIQGGTPWKPSRWGQAIGGLGQLYGSYLQGQEVGRKRRMEEELFPFEKELLRSRAGYYRQPRGTVYPEGYQRDLAAAVDALNVGEYDVFQVFRSMSQRYPAQSAELARIILAEEKGSKLESVAEEYFRSQFPEQYDEAGIEAPKKTFQLPGAAPSGITPLPGARPGIPTPLPGAKYPAPTEYLRTREVPEILGRDRLRKPIESREVPRKVTPGLEAIAKKAPARDETSVISKLMRRPKEEPAKPTKQTFDKYPAPKTEKEFDETIKHIPSKEMKVLYFETMIRRIEDEKLAERLYQKWVNELYKE